MTKFNPKLMLLLHKHIMVPKNPEFTSAASN